MNRMDDKPEQRLNALFVEYRNACPEPDPAADFMPRLWQKIDQRRNANARVFRRLTEVCVMATVALTLLMGAILIPRIQAEAFFAGTYAEELTAEHINADLTDVLNGGDIR